MKLSFIILGFWLVMSAVRWRRSAEVISITVPRRARHDPRCCDMRRSCWWSLRAWNLSPGTQFVLGRYNGPHGAGPDGNGDGATPPFSIGQKGISSRWPRLGSSSWAGWCQSPSRHFHARRDFNGGRPRCRIGKVYHLEPSPSTVGGHSSFCGAGGDRPCRCATSPWWRWMRSCAT